MLREGEGGARGAGRRENPGGGLQDGRGRGLRRESAANWGIGGGLNIFFRARNAHQEKDKGFFFPSFKIARSI